jgi:hypothetical protein
MDLLDLDMRIGVHTGRVVAGIIGSKVVRYDIFGNGVLIANKMESNGVPGQVCISDDTRKLLLRSPEVAREYSFEPHNEVHLPRIGKKIQTWIVTQRTTSESYEDSQMGSGTSGDEDSDADSSEGAESIHREQIDSKGSNEEKELKLKKRSKKVA